MADAGDAQSGPATGGISHHRLLGQPHDEEREGPVAAAERVAAGLPSPTQPLGPLGRRFNWRSPFFVGLAAAAGVAVTVGVVQVLMLTAQTLLLIALGLFLAIGLEPAVSWLIDHRVPRWLAVIGVLGGLLLVVAGFVAAAVPALIDQVGRLVEAFPAYITQLGDASTTIGSLNARFHVQDSVEQFLSGNGPGLASGVISVGEAIFSTFFSLLVVLVLTAYFMADMPRVRTVLYRFVPGARRPRAILIGDQVMVKVGGYVLGNVVLSLIAAVATFAWLFAWGVPYPLLLAILFALLDLVPVIGSLVAGALVALSAFSVSVTVGVASVGYFVAYKLVEDYVLTPRVFGTVLRLPALVTVSAILIGGALLGLVGALIALPAAAAITLLVQEVLFPKLDRIGEESGRPPGPGGASSIADAPAAG